MENASFMDKEVYIPIGSNCNVAWYLTRNGYRNTAYPFDWTVTPINSALTLLHNNFQDFFKKSNLIFLKPTYRLLFKNDEESPELTEDIVTPVYDTKYHILYVHDFSIHGKSEFDNVKQKYLRRIRRLQAIWEDTSIRIYLIYTNESPNEWQQKQYNDAGFFYQTIDENIIRKYKIERDNTCILSLDEFKRKKGISQ